jgi:hypothetical protein
MHLNSYMAINQNLLGIWGILLEKLIINQIFKKFPAFYGIRTFMTVNTTAHHLPIYSSG